VDFLDTREYVIDFTDDSGRRVKMEKPASRIISLYSAHTENLFALELDAEIIGVGTSESYPVEFLDKPVFDYKSDPEKVIAANPDLVLIRPFIERKQPDFVDAIRQSGITVVSFYPTSQDAFDDYIKNLGVVTGREKMAERKLKAFHEDLEELKALTEGIKDKKHVFFESSDVEIKTVTPDSMAARAIEIAGGLNIASDAEAITKGSSIAAYGPERVLEKADKIDAYVTQRGVMGAGGNLHTISIRPGFDTIKAVQEGKVLEINQKIISSPTFRQVKGAYELARFMYPEIFDDLTPFKTDEPLNRVDAAELFVRFAHRPVFAPTSSYYDSVNENHTYGMFEDVPSSHERFDFVETALNAGYMDGFVRTEDDEEIEYFGIEESLTRDELAKTLFLFYDLVPRSENVEIADLEACDNERIVQTLVDYGILELEEGQFNPERIVTGNEVVEVLENIK
jgi:iron complex transport system substrate-binding protein